MHIQIKSATAIRPGISRLEVIVTHGEPPTDTTYFVVASDIDYCTHNPTNNEIRVDAEALKIFVTQEVALMRDTAMIANKINDLNLLWNVKVSNEWPIALPPPQDTVIEIQ